MQQASRILSGTAYLAGPENQSKAKPQQQRETQTKGPLMLILR